MGSRGKLSRVDHPVWSFGRGWKGGGRERKITKYLEGTSDLVGPFGTKLCKEKRASDLVPEMSEFSFGQVHRIQSQV